MVPRKFSNTYIREISTKSGLLKAKPCTLMPIAIIVPILEIESILSNGVGPFMALTKHINTEIPKIDNVKKNIIYLSQ